MKVLYHSQGQLVFGDHELFEQPIESLNVVSKDVYDIFDRSVRRAVIEEGCTDPLLDKGHCYALVDMKNVLDNARFDRPFSSQSFIKGLELCCALELFTCTVPNLRNIGNCGYSQSRPIA